MVGKQNVRESRKVKGERKDVRESRRVKVERKDILESVRKGKLMLQSLSEEFKNDREIVIASVQSQGWSLMYASENLKNDEEIVVEALHKDGRILKFAGESMKSNKEIVTIAVKNNPKYSALEYASLSMQDNWDVVMCAVQFAPDALKFASNRLKNERDIVEMSLSHFPQSFKYVGENLVGDSVLLKLLKKHNGNAEIAMMEYSSLREGNQLRKDDSLALEFVKRILEEKPILNKVGIIFTDTSDSNIKEVDEKEEEEEIKELKEQLTKKKVDEDFEIYRRLGKGAFGSTYLCYVQGLQGFFVLKMYNDPNLSKKKKLEYLRRDCLDIPYHKNVVTILHNKPKSKIDLRKLPDYEEWKTKTCIGDEEYYLENCAIIIMKYHRYNLQEIRLRKSKKWTKSKKEGVVTRTSNFFLYEVVNYFENIIQGICHLHKNMIVHRDLHFGNIFVDPSTSRLWIGDFGCSLDLRENPTKFLVNFDHEQMCSFLTYQEYGFRVGGYLRLLAPEIRAFEDNNNNSDDDDNEEEEEGEGYDDSYGHSSISSGFGLEEEEYLDYEKCDVYSVGVLIGDMVDNNFWRFLNRDIEGSGVRAEGEGVEYLVKMSKKMTREDKETRMSCYEANECMKSIIKFLDYVYFRTEEKPSVVNLD